MIGNAEGTITRCGVTMNGTLQIKEAVYAGCVLGHAVNTVCDQLIVSVKNLDASADIAAGLAGYAEGCTFSGSADASVTDVTVSGSLRSTGIASGVLGNAINTTLIGVDAGISEVSGSTAAGFLGVGDNVDATNCKVVITKSVTGTNGAAGVAGTIGSESVFNHVPVTLTGVTVSADGGNAAGYALEIKARAIVMGQSHVTLGGYQTSGNVLVPVNAAVIRGSQNAAGYAYTVAGSVGEAHVVGCGQIHGGNAAGFAVEVSGSISDAFVSPALTQDDAGYLGNSNANLSVTGTDSAAGFVLNVDKNGSVSTAYTLCAVSSSGTIEIEKEPEPTEETTEPSEATDPSEATTAPTEIQMESVVSAYGFAGTNSGTISRSAANVDLDSGFGFVGVNNGLITTCYGWYGDGKDDSATTARGKIAGTGNCYSTYIAQLENQARDQKSVMVYDDDGLASEVTPNKLQSLSFSGFTSGYDAHPYAPMNPEDYLYPMLRDHFGSWIIPPQYSTGVAYYERYEDGSIKTHMYDLSDSSLTMEQADITTDMKKVVFDNALAITETGYAMFYNAASGEGDGEPILTEIVGAYTYNFFPIDGTGVVKISKPMGQAKYAYINTRFADAVKVNAEFGTDETYQLRTPEQLANMEHVTASFNQTHDISTTDVTTANIADRKTYDGNNLKLTITGQTKSWLSDVSGTVKDLELTVEGAVAAPIFGTVSGSLVLIGIQTGDISESAALVAESSGNVSFGSIRTGAMSGHLIDTITSGTVNTGNVELATRTNTLVGTFQGGILRGSESEQRTINVTDGTVLTSTLFCDKAGGEIRNYTITAPSQTGALAKTMTKSMSGVSVEVQGDASGVFLGIMSGDMNSVELIVDGTMNGSAIGAVITNDEKIPTLTNVSLSAENVTAEGGVLVGSNGGSFDDCEVDVTNVTASGANFGIVADKLDQGNTLDATVNVGTLSFTAKAASNVGGLVGVNAGSITGSTVTILAAEPVAEEQTVLEQAVSFVTELFVQPQENQEITAQGVTLNGAAEFQTTFGGLTGSNSGTISGSKANVDVTYVQPNDVTTDKAVLGGLVGAMSGGSITGTGTNDATGSITLSGDGNGRAYVVGGAVGKDSIATTNATVEYKNISASVTIDGNWATSNQDNYACPSGKGSVGMFVGHVHSGTFNTCSSNADNAEAYQFLGTINVTSETFKDAVYGNANLYATNTVTNECKETSDKGTSKIDASYTAYDAGEKARHSYTATLTNCTFALGTGDAKQRNIQNISEVEYFYSITESMTEHFEIASLTMPAFTSAPGISHSQFADYAGQNRVPTQYYHKHSDGNYYRVYVSLTKSWAVVTDRYECKLEIQLTNGTYHKFSSGSWDGWNVDKPESVDLYTLDLTGVNVPDDQYIIVALVDGKYYVLTPSQDGTSVAATEWNKLTFNSNDALYNGIFTKTGNSWISDRFGNALNLNDGNWLAPNATVTWSALMPNGVSNGDAVRFDLLGGKHLSFSNNAFVKANAATANIILFSVDETHHVHTVIYTYLGLFDQACGYESVN